ncbi:MAG: hypothetical protein ACYC5N_03650, partial [Endomicrobiales bacterium]
CTQVFREGEFKVGKKVWEDTVLVMPAELSGWKEVITLQSLKGERELSLNEVLKYFPVALLSGS